MAKKQIAGMLVTRLLRFVLMFCAAVLAPSLCAAQANPNQGPGGPVLVVTSGTTNFGRFYAEILRTEGFNNFAVADISAVTATTLNSYDVVILAKTAVSSSQATMFDNWVSAGGNLIAMDPAPQLANLLGIVPTGSTLANGYLLVGAGTRVGSGIVNQSTIQFHGSAQLSTLNGASALATLYSTSTTPTVYPAVTLRSVGPNGGQAASFAYDLATSIVYTRQGNPAWIGQERDGIAPRRSSDLFFGNAAGDPQPNWIDLTKVAIPQADEQQRFLANLIIDMNADRKPLPRFWYFPNGHKAVVIMTGDDHGNNGTTGRFNQFIAASPAGCSVANWECVRGTSYLFFNTPMTNAQAAAFDAAGFEVGLHVNTQCADYTQSSLENFYTTQIAQFQANFPSLPALQTERHHCIAYSDWASGPKVELNHGIRLDTNYYYWPPGFVNNVPGHFSGSAMPMRFADTDGSLIDVYQAVSQMTDESGQQYPFTVDTLLDRAIGGEEQYGAYTINAHTDVSQIVESTTTIQSAQERGVPIIAARQMLKWLDARNSSSFSALSWASNTLNFSVTQNSAATGLQAMVPRRAGNLIINTVKRNGTDVEYEVATRKGFEYAVFTAPTGSYVATYILDTVAPAYASRTPAIGATGVSVNSGVTVGFSESVDPSTITSSALQLKDASGNLINATVTYDPYTQSARLSPTSPLVGGATYTVTVSGVKDLAGNALATSTWSFTTSSGSGCPCTIFDSSSVPAQASAADPDAVEVGVKFRSDLNGFIKGIRFYKGTANTGTHVGSLWSLSGQLLASATFINETASGWQQVNFSTPVAITANTTYVASYFAPNGGYANNASQFAGAGVDKMMLHALSNGAAGGNGVYLYGTGGVFPTFSFQSTNYWVDVVFDTTAATAPDTAAPTVTITAPTGAATFGTTTASLTLGGTASDNLGVTQVSWSNDRGGNGVATGTTTWSINGVALQSGVNVITVTARDAANNTSTDVLNVTYTPATDNTPPTISSRSPASGATDVIIGGNVTVTFSEAMATGTIGTNTIELRNAANVLVTATVTYDAASLTATLAPTSVLAANTTYTVTVRGGSTDPRVKDVAGNALAANAVWSFTTGSATASIFLPTQAPVGSVESDPDAVELGQRFRASTNGQITAIRFYKNPENTGTHVGSLWSATGTLLGSATFVSETASGWQQVLLPTPVSITANTSYIVSYHTSSGSYIGQGGMFATSGITSGPLYAPRDGEFGANGVYRYTTTPASAFPDQTFGSSGYWVDVVFSQGAAPPDTTAPTIASRTPASGATGVSLNASVNVTFSEAMNPATITTSSIELRNASNVLVPATVSYNSTTFVATLTPSNALALAATYTVTVKGGATDPRVKDAAGIALAASSSWSFTTVASSACAANAITIENCLTGNSPNEWDITGAGDPSIQGFATQISVNRGTTISFKVKTDAANYRFDIYRMGYYGGLGARKITTVQPSATLPQNQPSCLTQASSGLIDCGNWGVSGSWAVPANATSGIYFAKLVRADSGGASHIVFIVRDDSSTSDMVFQTSDTTWQAYNNYGGNSLYQGSPGTNPARAYKVSYNRPFNTRVVDNGQDWVFNAEYPMVRWLEANGYNVSYISGLDTHRAGSLLTNHRAFLSVGHDEYWSGTQRTNVEAARSAGVHLAFFSGNEVFWKTRWENSIDGSGTAFRTLVSYKETQANAKIDPSAEWTGTWRDPRFSPPADGGKPENALTGTAFIVNSGTSSIVVPAADGKMRFWRGTSIANLSAGQSATLPNGTLGYEWDSDLDNGFRPAGLVRLSDTTVAGVDALQDFGSTYATGTVNHALTFYKHASGARVFGAGTIQWSWGLDATHDRAGTPADARMQQATVNLFADMNVQPATLQAGLTAASASTDGTAPTTVITSPTAGATVATGSAVTVTGTAADVGGVVGAVEVSVDGGILWHPATGRGTWTYTFTPSSSGALTIRVRASDDSGNVQATPTTVAITVGSGGGGSGSCPCTLFSASQAPSVAPDIDPGSVALGTRFRSNVSGKITAIRFYKNAGNTGTHVGRLWTNTGTSLATVTFNNESASGWQQANLTTPINITANTWYVVSYHTSSGSYIGQDGMFATSGITSGPLYASRDGEFGANGVYAYGPSSTFPNQTYMSEGYWVDVVFAP